MISVMNTLSYSDLKFVSLSVICVPTGHCASKKKTHQASGSVADVVINQGSEWVTDQRANATEPPPCA